MGTEICPYGGGPQPASVIIEFQSSSAGCRIRRKYMKSVRGPVAGLDVHKKSVVVVVVDSAEPDRDCADDIFSTTHFGLKELAVFLREHKVVEVAMIRRAEGSYRNTTPIPGRSISPQVAAALLIKLRTELSSHQADIIARLKQQCPDFAVMRKLVLGFRTILRVGKVSTLHGWMEQARQSGIHALVRFVRTLKQDLAAVEAALSQPWSSGPWKGRSIG